MADSSSTPPAKSYSSDPALYLYTSLTSGSSHIVTATSRLETILKANRVPFKAIDIATDEKARMLWGRRAGKDEGGRVRKIPGLVQMGLVLGDLVEIEDWNEYGELKQHVKIYYDAHTTPAKGTPTPTPNITPAKKTPSKIIAAEKPELPSSTAESTTAATKPEVKPEETGTQAPVGGMPTAFTLAMKQAGEEAAKKAKDGKKKVLQVFDGTGGAVAEPKSKTKAPETSPSDPELEPEPAKVENDKAAKSAPVAALDLSSLHIDDLNQRAVTSMQSPTSTAWKLPLSKFNTVQSPTSGAWKSLDTFVPQDVDGPIMMHRGSGLEEVSPEEIKAVEDCLAIKEEDEPEDEEA